MFERFTDRARRVIALAQDAAREMGEARIEPEHLLVGLRECEGMAGIAMAYVGVDGTTLRERVAGLAPRKPAAKGADVVALSSEGKECLQQALRTAQELGQSFVGTEHLFFGVERQAAMRNQSLDEVLGVSSDAVHRRLTEMLGDAPLGR